MPLRSLAQQENPLQGHKGAKQGMGMKIYDAASTLERKHKIHVTSSVDWVPSPLKPYPGLSPLHQRCPAPGASQKSQGGWGDEGWGRVGQEGLWLEESFKGPPVAMGDP